jgi:small subunit ribosomal protein S19
MVRSIWKGPYAHPALLRVVRAMAKKNVPQKAAVKVMDRGTMILPEMIGVRFAVHNGKKFEPVEVTDQHIGFKVRLFTILVSPPMTSWMMN